MHRNAIAVTQAAAARGVTIAVIEYPGEGARTAIDAGKAIGVEVGQIVKSLVFAVGDPSNQGAGEPVVALVCGDDQLQEAQLATAAGTAAAWRLDAQAVRQATGYPVGGVPPIGHATDMRMFADVRLRRFTTVWAAAGTPSHVFEIGITELVAATNATWANLSGNHDSDLAPLAVTHPRPTGRDVLGTIPLSARPARLSALPSVTARAVAFGTILLGGLIGGLLTYAVRKVMSGKTSGMSIGLWTIAGAVGTAFGTGILAILALRAMGEWRSLNQAGSLDTVLGND